MGDLTKNFSRWEFVCPGENCCNNSAPVDSELVISLQSLRDTIDAPIYISRGGGFRCNRYNARLPNASSNSMHQYAIAADCSSPEVSPEELAQIAEQILFFANGGIGVYRSHVHLDTRGIRARWRV